MINVEKKFTQVQSFVQIVDMICKTVLSKPHQPLNFNSDNGRFVLAMGFGYVAGDVDTISIAYGTCDKF